MPGELASRDGTVADTSRELIGRTYRPLDFESGRQELLEMQSRDCDGLPGNANAAQPGMALVDGIASIALLDLLERLAACHDVDGCDETGTRYE